jgi:hypothetical protein
VFWYTLGIFLKYQIKNKNTKINLKIVENIILTALQNFSQKYFHLVRFFMNVKFWGDDSNMKKLIFLRKKYELKMQHFFIFRPATNVINLTP